ncbi:dihydropteroate synthase [Microbacterium halophytorum]|uniref:dihydropteroate synthase n=1 Tax=Microbacterium halophytorum TaxID=2067568 RepID=UPI001E38D013|nr:dihydropteroate synthase [Microbacterium halophytorum]
MEVWGVVNVTPDSFSDGGEFFDQGRAIAHGRELLAAGATILDIGGESTRPGSMPIGAEEELRRVLPVIEALAGEAVVSVDTYRAVVAERAVAAGARIVNDVSGGLEDPRIFEVAAAAGVQIAIGHWRGPSSDMYRMARYERVGAEIAAELSERVAQAIAAGVRRDQVILDPGIGFAKTPEQSWAALRELDEVRALGLPVLVGVSRKRFLATALGEDPSRDRRDFASAVVSVLAAQAGAYGVRVHDVAATTDALAVLGEWAPAGIGAVASGEEAPDADAPAEGRGGAAVPGTIELNGLAVFGRHGVFDFERENGQEFVVDVSLRLDTAPAAASDDVADTVHYGELADAVAAIVGGEPVNLIETLAARIADAVLAFDARIDAAVVAVHKPHAPIEQSFRDVAVTATRERRGTGAR